MSSIEYAPYGEPLNPGANPSPFGFTGEYTDPNGLVYLRNRYYDPVLGVFLSPDPLAQALGSPSNLYTYADANPINYTDPSGLVAIDSCGLPTNLPQGIQPTEDAFYCDGRTVPNNQLNIGHNVILTTNSPSAACADPSNTWAECNPGCWTPDKVQAVRDSVAAQIDKIGETGFADWLAPSPQGIKIVMSKAEPGYGAVTPVPEQLKNGEYPAGPRRIVIWGNGNVTWANSDVVIFSPELITHEFGHVLSNEWANRESQILQIAQQLSQRFFNDYYRGSFARQLDIIRVNENTFAYLWEPFASGSSNTNADGTRNRRTGRFYDSRFGVEEFGAEAYAVWIHDKYAGGSQQPAGQSVTVDELVEAQKAFWEAVFNGSFQPGEPITPFDQP